MNSEYIVCLQNFDKKFFRPTEGPRVPPGGVIFRLLKFSPILCFSWWGLNICIVYLVFSYISKKLDPHLKSSKKNYFKHKNTLCKNSMKSSKQVNRKRSLVLQSHKCSEKVVRNYTSSKRVCGLFLFYHIENTKWFKPHTLLEEI